MNATMTRIGWFGKIPSLGDFAQRRLPGAFVRPWDQWLQDGIALAQRRVGPRFVELLTTFAVWRFAVPPGVFGETAWIGILLPSADRVGRAFPLTLAEPIAADDFVALDLPDIDRRLEGFARAGTAALDGATVEELDAALSALPDRTPIGEDTGARSILLSPAATGSWITENFAIQVQQMGRYALMERLGSRALWWVPAARGVAGIVRLASMPPDDGLLGELIAFEPVPAGARGAV